MIICHKNTAEKWRLCSSVEWEYLCRHHFTPRLIRPVRRYKGEQVLRTGTDAPYPSAAKLIRHVRRGTPERNHRQPSFFGFLRRKMQQSDFRRRYHREIPQPVDPKSNPREILCTGFGGAEKVRTDTEICR